MRILNHTSIIGERDRRVTIQIASTVRGTTGTSSITYNTVDTVWAAMKHAPQGKESDDEMQVVASQMVVWEIRYRSDIDITEKYQLIYKTRTYDILSIEEYGRNELWIIKTLIQSPNSVIA
jgi:head-tail adaptor